MKESCLLLSTITKEDIKPFIFNSTKIKVFSIEEALYHCYYHWNESLDEFNSNDFIDWVSNELKLPVIANNIKKIKLKESFTERLISFLTIIYYFDENEIKKLKDDLFVWEHQSVVEKLKERADNLLKKEKIEAALGMYVKSLEYEKNNVKILNNIGVALMKKGEYKKALKNLKKAFDIDERNPDVIYNLIEAYICNYKYNEAQLLLDKVIIYGETADLCYFQAEIYLGKGNYDNAIKYYKKSIEIYKDFDVCFKLVDVFVVLKQFDEAVKVLDDLGDIDENVLIKKSEIFVAGNNISAAVKCIERALFYNRDSVKLWTILAKYYRFDYNLNKAEGAALKALSIKKDDEKANFELAKIRKEQGKNKEYQSLLSKILNKLKSKYKESIN